MSPLLISNFMIFTRKLHNLNLLAYLATPSTSVASMPASSSSCSGAGVVANTTELQLTDREKARLDELFLASRALVEPVEHERDVIRYFILLNGIPSIEVQRRRTVVQ